MSIQSRFLKLVLRLTRLKSMFRPLNVAGLRKLTDRSTGPRKTHGCTYNTQQIAQTHYTLVTPPSQTTAGVLIYLHGGAYVTGIADVHWNTLSYLCAKLGRQGIMLDYALAPESSHPAALNDVLAVYAMCLQTHAAGDVSFVGDSAGAGLAVGTVLCLNDDGQQLPGKLVLFSPWLDLTMQNPAVPALEKVELVISAPGLIEAGQLYAGAEDPAHPYLSPINGGLACLPPTLLQIGTHDVFLPDCQRFSENASKAGVDITYTEAPKMFHAYSLFGGVVPEATAAIQDAVQFLT